MVILGQRDHVTFWRDLEAAAPTDFDVRTFKLADERAFSLEHGHMEAVAMAVADQHVAGVADVDAVREVGDVLASDATQKLAVLIENYDTVSLWKQRVNTDKSLHNSQAED